MKIHPHIKKGLRFLKWSVICFFLCIAVYLLFAVVLALIPTQAETTSQQNEQMYEVYVLKSGPHSDFFVPVKSRIHDWNSDFPYSNNINPDTNLAYVAIGWGDKDFYLNTPTWGDLTAGTALAATFGTGTAAVHASYYYGVPDDRPLIKLNLTENQYARLVDYIRGTLQSENSGKRIMCVSDFPGVNGAHDRYYEAYGTYSMIYTCNTWVNNGLKACGQKACFWTGFANGIFYQYGI